MPELDHYDFILTQGIRVEFVAIGVHARILRNHLKEN